LVRVETKPEAERVGKYMIRPLLSVERLTFLEPEGKVGYRHGEKGAEAFDAAEGAAGGVRALAEQAMKAGATKEEIAETLRVAFHLSGVGSLYAASFGLKDILG